MEEMKYSIFVPKRHEELTNCSVEFRILYAYKKMFDVFNK